MTAPAGSWTTANQRYLMAALESVRRRLAPGDSPPPQQEELTPPPAIEVLCKAFSLSAFERAVLLLCAGVELDASFAALVATVRGDGQRQPDFALALGALENPHWSALSPTAPLRLYRLVEPASRGPLTTAPLRIDERVLHYLTGVDTIDERLLGLLTPGIARPAELMPSQRGVADRAAVLLAPLSWSEAPALLQLCGRDPASLRAVAAQAATAAGLGLLSISAADLPPAAADREVLLRLCEREAVLGAAAIHLELNDAAPETAQIAASFAEKLRAPVLITSREPV
ncbi:MAG TPA: hypothetical protein VH083_23290, partial [Myxococcales bacterium]|nr:hypothetical protein [Myxococcales bacterium]